MLGIHMHNLFHWWWMAHGIQAEVKENTKTREKPSKAIIACRVREGLVWTNNHNQHWCSNLIKLLMTCHSRAGQMFIDAQYQPHSSSVRVTALAAMSPTTPTHLALPPHSTGGWGGGLESGSSFQVADGGCWAVTMCIHTIRGEGSCVFIYLFIYYFFFFHSHRLCFGHGTTPLPPFSSHCPCSSPICDVEAAILLWRLPQLSPWRVTLMTNWVWKWRWWAVKAMPLPPLYTLWTYTRRRPDTQIRGYRSCVCVYAISHSILSATKALPWDKAGVVL